MGLQPTDNWLGEQGTLDAALPCPRTSSGVFGANGQLVLFNNFATRQDSAPAALEGEGSTDGRSGGDGR